MRRLVLAAISALSLAQGARAGAILTEADAGMARAAAVGETIELRLKENPSTGYVWSVAVDPPGAASILSRHRAAKSSLVGAPGTREIALTIRRAGPLTIRATNGRPWEGAASAAQRLEFRIEAR
jgi:inhibitor of cysteine peptidase